MKSYREIQEDLLALGAIDNFNRPLVPMKIYDYAYANNVSDALLDGALGWRMGTSTLWVIAHGLAHLTGETAGDVRPVESGVYGSGIEGTQAPAAPAATPYVGPSEPDPTLVHTDEERCKRWRAIATNGGWDLTQTEHMRTALKYAQQMGMAVTAADVERWESLPAGTLGA